MADAANSPGLKPPDHRSPQKAAASLFFHHTLPIYQTSPPSHQANDQAATCDEPGVQARKTWLAQNMLHPQWGPGWHSGTCGFVDMAYRPRRSRNLDLTEPVAGLVGLLLIISIVSPQVRETIRSFGTVCLYVALVVLTGLLCFLVWAWATRKRALQEGDDLLKQVRAVNLTDLSVIAEAASDRASGATTDGDNSQATLIEDELVGSYNGRWLPGNTANVGTDSQLHERLLAIDWFQFEQLMALMFKKLGYIVTHLGGANPDGGIDLILGKGDESVAVQCKHWKTWNVGVAKVRELIGAMTDSGISKGMLITFGGFTNEARQLASRHNIDMLGRGELLKMLTDLDAVYDPQFLAILNDTTKHCPKCGSQMVLRTATKGPGSGEQFWGCTAYPRCRYTMPYKCS